jgi:hypothetical protein
MHACVRSVDADLSCSPRALGSTVRWLAQQLETPQSQKPRVPKKPIQQALKHTLPGALVVCGATVKNQL